MTLASARAWLDAHAPDLQLIVHDRSTATVAEAAAALGVKPGRIAKTLALRLGDVRLSPATHALNYVTRNSTG